MFRVQCKLWRFERDEKKHPCHFNYKVGDEIYYDGVNFTGRICHGLIPQMMPVVHAMFLEGNRYHEGGMYRFRGDDTRDPAMTKYDGFGFRPLKEPDDDRRKEVEGLLWVDAKTGRLKGGHFLCADHRTLAHFAARAVDLSDSDYAQPFYRRCIAVLEKVELEPGVDADELLERFSPFEREEIAPALTPPFVRVLVEALEDVGYVDIREGKVYATGKEPPSRPRIG